MRIQTTISQAARYQDQLARLKAAKPLIVPAAIEERDGVYLVKANGALIGIIPAAKFDVRMLSDDVEQVFVRVQESQFKEGELYATLYVELPTPGLEAESARVARRGLFGRRR